VAPTDPAPFYGGSKRQTVVVAQGPISRLQAGPPTLAEGETILGSWLANHSHHVAAGGRLWLTSHRLVFMPNRFEVAVMRRKPWSCGLSSITDITVARRGLHPFNGAWRRRLEVVRGARMDRFVVKDAKDLGDLIRGNLPTAGQRT